MGPDKNKPCKDCYTRYIGCHDKCEDYQAVKRKYTKTYSDTDNYLFDKRVQLKKKYGEWP
jgi:hypothetical protein